MKTMKCFMMMQFKGKHQDEIFNHVQSAIENLNNVQSPKIILNRADMGIQMNIVSLEEHLKEHITKCDFAIAEISQLNSNVMFEIGYAIGIEKPIIIMAKKGVKLPTDFRGRLYFQYSTDELEMIPQSLQRYIKSAIQSCKEENQKTFYKTQVYISRQFSDLIETINTAKQGVEILTTNLISYIDSAIPDALLLRLEKVPGFTLRILTLDPESEFTAFRARQLGKNIRYFREELRNALTETYQKFSAFNDRCEIATFDEFPLQVSCHVDTTIYLSTMSSNRVTRENIVFKIPDEKPNVKESIVNHFKLLWSRSQPYHPSPSVI
jgi:nucleoside 2-deoxyribosyltransferase